MKENEEPLPDYSDDWANQKPEPLIGRSYPSSAFDFSTTNDRRAEPRKDEVQAVPASTRDPEIEEILKSSDPDDALHETPSNNGNFEDETTEDSSTEHESSDGVVYKKERPFAKFLMWTGIALLSALAILFIVGFIIGLSGSRPPNFDGQVIYDQWNNLAGNEPTVDDTIDELSKNKP